VQQGLTAAQVGEMPELLRVRRVDAATGIITTMAGNGVAGWAGDGGPAVNGSLHYPMGLAFDLAGNLYIADAANYRIRREDAATAMLTTIAGTGVNGAGVVLLDNITFVPKAQP